MPDQPLLPAQTIFKSDVFIKGAGALLAQLVSLGFRVWKYFSPEIDIDEDMIQGFIADGLQIVAAALAFWSLNSRKNSAIAPLTYTAKGAEAQNAANPPMLTEDPTKVPPVAQTATITIAPASTKATTP